MMSDPTAPASRKRPNFRWVWTITALLALFLVLALAYSWSQRSTMQLVARIILPPNAVLSEGNAGPVLLSTASGVLMGIS